MSAPTTTHSTHTPGHGGNPGKTLEEWSSLIGIITAIVGNIIIALALNVQRYAHTRLHKERASIRRRAQAALKRAQSQQSRGYGTLGGNGNGNGPSNGSNSRADSPETDPLTVSFHSGMSIETTADETVKQQAVSTYLKSPYWWLGQVLITVGETGNFLAYGFAPASIVSPLGVVALISNCIIAPLMFKEQFRHRDFWGVVVAVGGVVTVVLSANTEETKLNPHDVWDAITTLAFEIYLGVTTGLIIFLMWASPRYGRRTILIDLGLVGLFGGYTALSTKGVSSMLSSTLWGAFATPVTYILVLILLGTAIMQIRYVNRALQTFESTQVIPIQFVMFTLSVILGSAILYRDFEKTTAEQAGKFVGGCLLTFLGVFFITSGRGHKDDDDDDYLSEADGVEETIGLAYQDGHQQSLIEPSATPTSASRSRRSSGQSHVSFANVSRTELSEEFDVSSPLPEAPGSTPKSLGLESASLLNMWSNGREPVTPPPRGIRTLSADVVMRGSQVISTPPQSNPGMLPPGHSTDQLATPPMRATTYGPGHHHTRSGTFISPSPLASTVTTVMKDGLLRGDRPNLAHRGSMRHLRSRIRASLFFNEDEEGSAVEDNSVPAFDNDLTRSSTHQEHSHCEDGDDEQPRTRTRSVSDTLGDFFRPKRKRRKDGASVDIEQGDGRGPRSEPFN